MSDWLDYGAIGLLACVLGGVGAFARIYLKDSLATNKELRDMCRALREALVGQGQRLAQLNAVMDDTRDMVYDLHRAQFGTKPGVVRRPRDGQET